MSGPTPAHVHQWRPQSWVDARGKSHAGRACRCGIATPNVDGPVLLTVEAVRSLQRISDAFAVIARDASAKFAAIGAEFEASNRRIAERRAREAAERRSGGPRA